MGGSRSPERNEDIKRDQIHQASHTLSLCCTPTNCPRQWTLIRQPSISEVL